ncbi:MAG TPA: SUMF1/EgtB/PvdO family nonheme iron enzyme [Steroidobacteraceae bacterium]|nr:SUMF1/EgtB/PvdO family nonheme iron enzyme [Steroidobacteraceae bacterium]
MYRRLTWLLGACLLSAVAAAAGRFEDCRACPRMVVIPGGTFTMGSPESEPERKKFEGPRSGVRIAAFAIGETEVTRGQYAVFARDTGRPDPAGGCFNFGFNAVFDSSDVDPDVMDARTSWHAHSFAQTDEHPVTCVSWQDARDYAAWLARRTGKAYRLPSESEWEYAARGGSKSIFIWGTDETGACRHANVADATLRRENANVKKQTEDAQRAGYSAVRFVECEDGVTYTAAVRGRQPNAFGLYDVIGNVWEYVADCWQEALPENGAAHDATDCVYRRVRGGSWNDAPAELRSARRSRVKPDVPRNDAGFRVARDFTVGEVNARAGK